MKIINILTAKDLRKYMRMSGVDIFGSVNANPDFPVWVKLSKQSLMAAIGESPDNEDITAFYNADDNAVYLG